MLSTYVTPPAHHDSFPQFELTLLTNPTGKDVLISVKPPVAPVIPDVGGVEKDENAEKEQLKAKRAPVDFVLTIDVSGSMATEVPVPGENG